MSVRITNGVLSYENGNIQYTRLFQIYYFLIKLKVTQCRTCAW